MSLLSELFSDFFAGRDNVLTRMDPRTTVVAALILLVGVVFASTPVLPTLVMIGCAGGAVAIRVPSRFVLLRLSGPLAIAVTLMIFHSLLTGATPLRTLGVGGYHITIMADGWRTGWLSASRVMGGTSVMLLLSTATPAHRIFAALRALGISKGWVEIAMLMYRYIFVLLDLTADVAAAQCMRLGYSSTRRSVKSAGVVAGVVVIRAVDQALRTNEAMLARGYHGEVPLCTMSPLARQDCWVIAGTALVITGSLILTKVWPC